MGVDVEAYREIAAGHHSRMADNDLSDRIHELAGHNIDAEKYPLLKRGLDGDTLTPAEISEANKQADALSEKIDPDTTALSDLLIRRARQGSLNEQDTQKLTELKNKISRDYNIPQDQLNQQIDAHAAWIDQNRPALQQELESSKIDTKTNITYSVPEMRRAFNDAAQGKDVVTQDLINGLTGTNDHRLARSDPGGPAKFTHDEIAQISHLYLEKQAGSLSPEKTKELDDRLNDLSEKTRIPPDDINRLLEANQRIIRNIPDPDTSPEERLTGLTEVRLAARGNRTGIVSETTVTVPDHTQDDLAIYRGANLPEDDLPSKKPPGTVDQWEFLTALHEAEHVTQSQFGNENGEIDADRAALKVLDDIDEPAMGEYWLQARQVNSFKNGLRDGANGFDHDTATFLRIEKETGQQIDRDAFRAEKVELVGRVHSKIDSPQNATIGDLMGATRDVLREGNLSDVQKAEAESFLADAKAIGYTENPDYPKAGQTPPAPAVPQQQQQLAAAAPSL